MGISIEAGLAHLSMAVCQRGSEFSIFGRGRDGHHSRTDRVGAPIGRVDMHPDSQVPPGADKEKGSKWSIRFESRRVRGRDEETREQPDEWPGVCGDAPARPSEVAWESADQVIARDFAQPAIPGVGLDCGQDPGQFLVGGHGAVPCISLANRPRQCLGTSAFNITGS
jgi:hypothetical protein